MQISAIIAAKEEALTIRRVVEQVKKYVSECIVVTPPDDFETQSALDGVECKILTEQKPGKGNAIVAGARVANYEVLVFIDADLSHNPHDIPRLTLPITNGDCDHVVASRMLGGSSELFDTIPNFIRLIGSHVITTAINKKFGSRLTDSQNGFRAITRELFLSFKLCESHTTIEQELTARTLASGHRMIEVPSHEFARMYGNSKIRVIVHGIRYVYVLLKILTWKRQRIYSPKEIAILQKRYTEVWYSNL